MASNPYLSVQALTKYIKRKFDADPHMRNVYVKGELSNVKLHSSGHIYFTLKDEKSRIQAAMFRQQANQLQFRPENGMNVCLIGDVTVYEANGQYQLYVQSMEPDGIGALYLAYEQLKEKLAQEGLFNEQWKSPLPLFPEQIGVVTAQTGAAIQDICSTIQRRYPLANIKLFPAIVQGTEAVASIVRAIEAANAYGNIDVLIVGRGGGSIEDLWAFNEEDVARAIFSSRIPIISAVGHETDTTIADFVADRRAPTPTAAAELAVPSREELLQRTMERKQSLFRALSQKIQFEEKRLATLQAAYPLQYPERLYRPFTEKLIELENRLLRNQTMITERRKAELARLHATLQSYSPVQRVAMQSNMVETLEARLQSAMQQQFRTQTEAFTTSVRMLQALNPLQIMERGYSIVYDEGAVVKSIEQIQEGMSVDIHLQDGSATATIQSKQQKV